MQSRCLSSLVDIYMCLFSLKWLGTCVLECSTLQVKLSLKLLHIADHLTDNILGFKLYFSDISLDNYVVTTDLDVLIADAENILIVDEQHLQQGEIYSLHCLFPVSVW